MDERGKDLVEFTPAVKAQVFDFYLYEVESVLASHDMTVDEAIGAVMHHHGISKKGGKHRWSDSEMKEFRALCNERITVTDGFVSVSGSRG